MFLSTRSPGGERGSLAPSVAAIIIVLFLLGGLIIDGARALGARSRAAAYAEEGARIAGQGVTFDEGRLSLDAATMQDNAEAYCARIAASDGGVGRCRVSQDAGDIVFAVDLTIDKGILGMVSGPTMTFTGEGRAIAEIGITEAQGSADEPVAVSSQMIPGNDVDVNIGEGATGCPQGKIWLEAPPTLEPRPFRYWTRADYQLSGSHCPVPPVCPGGERGNPPVGIPHRYKKDQESITYDVLRSGENWNNVYQRCPIVPPNSEDFLYTFEPRPKCELGDLPGSPPTCKPLDLPPCPVGEDEPGQPPECNPLDLPTCKDRDKPGKPPTCRPKSPKPSQSSDGARGEGEQ